MQSLAGSIIKSSVSHFGKLWPSWWLVGAIFELGILRKKQFSQSSVLIFKITLVIFKLFFISNLTSIDWNFFQRWRWESWQRTKGFLGKNFKIWLFWVNDMETMAINFDFAKNYIWHLNYSLQLDSLSREIFLLSFLSKSN